MIIVKRNHGYSSRRKYIHGQGFVDSLTSTLRNVGSYVSQNRDLIAKPLLGAVGKLAASGLTEGTKLLLNHIINKNTQKNVQQSNTNQQTPQLDDKALEILENLMKESQTSQPVGNIIGSGIKKIL